jgi:hypothetical protein
MAKSNFRGHPIVRGRRQWWSKKFRRMKRGGMEWRIVGSKSVVHVNTSTVLKHKSTVMNCELWRRSADDCRNRSKGNIWMLRRVLGGGMIVRGESDGGMVGGGV